jgi:hypothetical protein
VPLDLQTPIGDQPGPTDRNSIKLREAVGIIRVLHSEAVAQKRYGSIAVELTYQDGIVQDITYTEKGRIRRK